MTIPVLELPEDILGKTIIQKLSGYMDTGITNESTVKVKIEA